MVIDYTAKRTLKSGHSADTSYQITVSESANDRLSTTVGSQSVSLDGTTVSVIHRSEVVLSITTELVNSSSTPDIDDMREFLDSVKFGETFQLDSADYILDNLNSPYREQRNHPGWFRYSFRARAL